MSNRTIELRKVRVNNLKNVDLDIPHGQWLSICGISGSGKSSLALDTLHAEGQRRYVESLSPSTRQFLQQLDKPDADRIEGIPPAVAVRANQHSTGPRTSVGTATETVFFLPLLFARPARLFCRQCGTPILKDEPESVAKWASKFEDSRFQVLFSVKSSPTSLSTDLEDYKSQGFGRAIVGQTTLDLRSDLRDSQFPAVDSFSIVVDRLQGSSPIERICESLETAFQFGRGKVTLLFLGSLPNCNRPANNCTVDQREWTAVEFSNDLLCTNCGMEHAKAEPRLFSFTSPLGACPSCEGSGQCDTWDLHKIIPDRELPLADHPIRPWRNKAFLAHQDALLDFAQGENFPVDLPFGKLEESHVDKILNGASEAGFVGVLPQLEEQLAVAKSKKDRDFLQEFRSPQSCPDCKGHRLNSNATAYRIAGHSIADVCGLPIEKCLQWLGQLEEEFSSDMSSVRHQIQSRLGYLVDVGIGYLTLNRGLNSLSRGEIQKITLASSLSSTLVNMLYVLDEPSVGLHSHDVNKVTNAIKKLQTRGNTIVVVDHQESVIQAADRVLEIGPEAGTRGGSIVFDGPPDQLIEPEQSLTGDFIAGRRGLSTGSENRRPVKARLKLRGARGNNLQTGTVEFPLGCLCVVTGISGSGKSSLVRQTLYPALCQRKKISSSPPLPFEHVFGESAIDDVVLVDQSPIGRSARSNPVTYIKAFDEIRKAYAETLDAKTHNLNASHFSFNVDGGRCDKCKGNGQLSVDMQFLADIYMTCDQCRGHRYREEVLSVKYRGKNISEALNMTARDAFAFFRGHPKVQAKLKSLIDVGLDYIRLGQPATNLSSGEAQRLKLALHLNSSKRRSLFLLDEPTTGLHMADVIRLMDCLEALLAVGHSLIVIEHNMNLIKYADWIIDLGPGAGDNGGRIVAAGTPEQLVQCPDSLTGKYLRPFLERGVS